MLCCQFAASSALLLGKPMTPNTQANTTATIIKILICKFLFMMQRQWKSGESLFGDLPVRGDQARNGPSRDLYLQVVRLYAKYQSIITIHCHYRSDNSSGRHHRLTVFKALQHRLLLFTLPLNGKKYQKIGDTEHQHDGQYAAEKAVRRGRLQKQKRGTEH
jgi:hypothetical protein